MIADAASAPADVQLTNGPEPPPRTRTNLDMEPEQLAQALTALGCPETKSVEMAAQLDKRARQLVEERGQTYDEAMVHLLKLMQQGWSAKEKGL